MKLTTTTFAALAVFGAAGFLIGRISAPDSAGTSDSAADAGASSRSSSRTSGAGPDEKSPGRASRSERAGMGNSSARLAKLESIVRGENALDRNRALLAFIDQLGPGEYEEAIEHFRSLGLNDSRNTEFALLLTAWAKADPVTALTYAREKTNGGFATDTVLTGWATQDPDAAIRWAQANHEGEDANPFLAGIIRGLAESDPARATGLLTGMPRSDQRGNALQAMMPHILRQGPEAARQWVADIGDGVLRDGAINRMAEALATVDPQGTADWLLANPGEAAARRMDDVYELWAGKNQQAALNSINSLPAGEYRADALEGVIGSVARTNPKEAVAIMDRYPNDVNDEIVRTLVEDSSRNDPETAAGQIFRIGDEGQREQMYRRTLGRWMDNDPTGAQAWIQRNPVSQNVMSALARRQAERGQQ